MNWSLAQTLPQNWTPASSGSAYPTNSLGAICELPFTQKIRYQTIVSRMESGPKYTFAEFGGGLTNFPTGGLMAWELENGMLNDTEVTTFVGHFLANWGDCFPFSFTDEDGTNYSNVYYASPQLTIVRNAVNMASIRTSLVQMN